MPLQLIFTSARQGLVPGRSGFCTVARHRAMPERLAQLLEALGTPHEASTGATFTFRLLEASGQRWYVLSRFVARGLDYTQRDNRLAHHLAFTQEEAMVLPPPAALAYRWDGWKDEWTGDPTWLEGEAKPLTLKAGPALTPAATWRQVAGTGAKAAWLVDATGPAEVALLNCADPETALRLLAESAALLGKSSWAASFTTDAAVSGAEGFRWCIGHVPGRTAIDLVTAAAQPAPTGDMARAAAMGLAAPAPAAAPTARQPKPAKSRDTSGPSAGLIVLVLAVVALASFLGWKVLQTPPPPTPPVVTAPPPTPIDTAKADEIMKANLALKDIDGLIDREEFIDAAKLWFETSTLSPEFAAKHRTRVVPRLTARYAEVGAARFATRLDALPVGGDGKDAAALAAHYGSVSAVTFLAALTFVQAVGDAAPGFMPTLVALLEVPGIVVALLLAKRREGRLGEALHEVLTGKSVVLLLGGLLVGLLSGEEGMKKVEAFFVEPFQGALTLFLLDLGMVAASRLSVLRQVGLRLVLFGVGLALFHGALGVYLGLLVGLGVGGAAVLGAMAASASYIAAPAAVRIALPEANPSLYLTASLAVTFPFNLVLGIPLYRALAVLWGG